MPFLFSSASAKQSPEMPAARRHGTYIMAHYPPAAAIKRCAELGVRELPVRQLEEEDSPARRGAYAASRRATNSVKSRTRLVLCASLGVRSQSVPCMRVAVPGTLTNNGSGSPTKHGNVAIPRPCRKAAS